MKEYNFLALDIGATSGRAMLGVWRGDRFHLNEINRFENPMVQLHGCLYWDVYALYNSIVESLRICAREGIRLNSVGIDTWGVDYGWLNGDGKLLSLPVSYRDPRNNVAFDDFLSLHSREELYMRTGIQLLPFNTIFQLHREMCDASAVRPDGGRLLFIPDLLTYMLTRRRVCEFTIASTSQLLDLHRGCFDGELIGSVGIGMESFSSMVMPGTLVGNLTDDIAQRCGVGDVPVIAVAGHDTASAVAAVPSTSADFAYLSSGTWSLMGIEVDSPIINEESMRNNFTNEGGIEGTTRFLKNIIGIGLESYTVGSYDFYLGYGAKKNKIVTLDTGHFHLTESIADKVSSLLLFTPEIMLHVSRPIRWDSDHVVILNDDVMDLAREIVRCDALDRVHIGLDYFDATINRIGAYVVGSRATLKAFLMALLEPIELLREYEDKGMFFQRLALQEEAKSLPWGAVWDMYCLQSGVPVGDSYIAGIESYEADVTSKRG